MRVASGDEDMHNSADYWIGKAADAGALLGPEARIAAFNRRALAHDRHLVNLAEYPARRGREEVERLVTGVSRPAPTPLFFLDGTSVTPSDYARCEASLSHEPAGSRGSLVSTGHRAGCRIGGRSPGDRRAR